MIFITVTVVSVFSYIVAIVILYFIIKSAVTKGIDASHTHDLLEQLAREKEEADKNNNSDED